MATPSIVCAARGKKLHNGTTFNTLVSQKISGNITILTVLCSIKIQNSKPTQMETIEENLESSTTVSAHGECICEATGMLLFYDSLEKKPLGTQR